MGKKVPEEQPELAEETVETEGVEEDAAEEELSLEDQLRAEVQTHQEQYLRTLANMENLRKRTQREKEELAKYANENILREILPVIDNLERAVEHAEQAESSEGLFEGVQMTLDQFSQVLTRFGVEPIESLGQLFDPALHQAMGQLETDEYPANTVAQQMQKGYQLNERLLRPAMVMVAKEAKVPKPEDDESTTIDENN
ncbi:MAG: nucleotide exchange factor GrpE [Desulfuromonadaceae bacterium]|nr:nucleotide exchange factor GrpE [Desulfuromonadaceae bacterium]